MQTIVTPKEIIWLNGPPGAGKGANLEFIKRIRGLSYSVVMSRVLARHPETATIMENGGLVSDAKVCECLLESVFNPENASPSGCIVDGFPRSEIQVRLAHRDWLLKRAGPTPAQTFHTHRLRPLHMPSCRNTFTFTASQSSCSSVPLPEAQHQLSHNHSSTVAVPALPRSAHMHIPGSSVFSIPALPLPVPIVWR